MNLSKISSVLGVTLAELLSGLEAGNKLVVESSREKEPGGHRLKIQKIVRRLRVQKTAADRALTSLEDLVFSSAAAKPSATRHRKHGSAKSK